ncbi:Integrase core domain protein [Gimesia panareensis]|uniref:Integrase core domain protein n=1 Tax=Gimesia panareensis TaxID=2527978 RepID=A0A518FUL1_9PLAN|nr:Integrase core domain protein [Gimesia panareensis]
MKLLSPSKRTKAGNFLRNSLEHDRDLERRAYRVLERLSDLFVCRGVPNHIRSDYGPEFTAELVRDRLQRAEMWTLFIEPGSPWENSHIESFNGKLRDELLNDEIFDTLWEAKVLIERWRRAYNFIRPHSSLCYRAPVLEAKLFCSPCFRSAPTGKQNSH